MYRELASYTAESVNDHIQGIFIFSLWNYRAAHIANLSITELIRDREAQLLRHEYKTVQGMYDT